jgi:hypothetical protein
MPEAAGRVGLDPSGGGAAGPASLVATERQGLAHAVPGRDAGRHGAPCGTVFSAASRALR